MLWPIYAIWKYADFLLHERVIAIPVQISQRYKTFKTSVIKMNLTNRTAGFKTLIATLLAGALISAASAADTTQILKSPDGKIAVTIATGAHLNYTVKFHGRVVVENSALGVVVDGRDLGRDATFAGK